MNVFYATIIILKTAYFECVLNMEKVALYARISTDNLGQDVSRQLVELRAVCDAHDWEIVDEYVDEGESGTKRVRPELDRMLKDARQRKFKKIVCLELSRIARSTKHLLDMVEELKCKNIHLYIHNQGIDTSTYMGEFFATVLSALAQIEVAQISERVKSGISNSRRKNGGAWGRPTNLTDTVAAQILEKRNEGWGIKRLAKEFSVSHQTVRKVLPEFAKCA